MTYETVVAATHGDPVAAEEVLEHFDSAIDGLCTHAFVDEGGATTEYGVDTQMKTEMQAGSSPPCSTSPHKPRKTV